MVLLPGGYALNQPFPATLPVPPCCFTQLRPIPVRDCRRHHCRQVFCSTAPPTLAVQTVSLSDADKKLSNDLSPSDLRKVWDSTGKPLLRVGKNGVQASHKRSLQELLLAHKRVKVQINQIEQSEVEDSGQQLADLTGAQLLQLKGRTALFASQGTGRKQLLPDTSARKASEQSLEKIWEQNPEDSQPVQLAAEVQTQLQHLRYNGTLSSDEPDRQCMRVLSQLSPASAVEVLGRMTPRNMGKVRNKSAWLNSQCRRRIGKASS